jgi:hypothetical protein
LLTGRRRALLDALEEAVDRAAKARLSVAPHRRNKGGLGCTATRHNI